MSTTAESAMSGITESTAGRSGTRARGRGRGRQGRGQGRQQNTRASTFKGATEEMNGHVFECYEEQTDRRQFARTSEELHGYVKKKLKFYEDIAPLFASDMAEPVVRRPVCGTSEGEGRRRDEDG